MRIKNKNWMYIRWMYPWEQWNMEELKMHWNCDFVKWMLIDLKINFVWNPSSIVNHIGMKNINGKTKSAYHALYVPHNNNRKLEGESTEFKRINLFLILDVDLWSWTKWIFCIIRNERVFAIDSDLFFQLK